MVDPSQHGFETFNADGTVQSKGTIEVQVKRLKEPVITDLDVEARWTIIDGELSATVLKSNVPGLITGWLFVDGQADRPER